MDKFEKRKSNKNKEKVNKNKTIYNSKYIRKMENIKLKKLSKCII
tara:strand:- start:19345 stop:19479 length:135 start_codon:yes stop_codon:yes gene_type:complete